MMFLASVFISRYGGQELFGFFSVVLGLIITATPVATFGMDAAIVRFLPKYRQEGRKNLVSGMQRFVLLFSGFLSILGGAILCGILIYIRDYSWWIGLSAGICLPLSVGLAVMQSAIRADANVSRAVASEAIARPFAFGTILLLLQFALTEKLTLLSIIGAYAAALFFANMTCLWLVIKGRHINWQGHFNIGMKEIRHWLQLGWNVLFSNLSIALLNQSPVILAGMLLSAFDAGELGAVMRLAMLVAFALTAVNSVITPFLSKAMAAGNNKELQSLVTRATAFSMAVALPVCTVFYVFAPFLLSVFGDAYQGAVSYLRMMLIAYIIHAAAGPGISLLNMTGIHRAATKIVAVWAVVTLVGLFVAMQQYGLGGGVTVASLSIAGYPVMLAILCRKTLGIDPTLMSVRNLF